MSEEKTIARADLDPEAEPTMRLRVLVRGGRDILQQWYDCRFQSGWVDVERVEATDEDRISPGVTLPDETHPEARPWLRITGPENNGPQKLAGFDEICAEGVAIHIERMNSSHYWMGITGPNGESQRVEFWAKGNRLFSGTERD